MGRSFRVIDHGRRDPWQQFILEAGRNSINHLASEASIPDISDKQHLGIWVGGREGGRRHTVRGTLGRVRPEG